MAKALLGHIGGTDPRMLAEVRRLQQRVRDLEDQLGRAKAENDALAAAMHADKDFVYGRDARFGRDAQTLFTTDLDAEEVTRH